MVVTGVTLKPFPEEANLAQTRKLTKRKQRCAITKDIQNERIFFWNSRGLRDLAKSGLLLDTTMDEGLDFISILETGRNEFRSHELSHFCGEKTFYGVDHLRKGDREEF